MAGFWYSFLALTDFEHRFPEWLSEGRKCHSCPGPVKYGKAGGQWRDVAPISCPMCVFRRVG